jgi:transposase-like protein
MAKTRTYSAETKAKAIRLVREHEGDYPSQWAAISAVASRLGMSAETPCCRAGPAGSAEPPLSRTATARP